MLRINFLVSFLIFSSLSNAYRHDVNYKVYRIVPANEEQLRILKNFNFDNYEQYTYWREPSDILSPVDLMIESAESYRFERWINSTGIYHEVMIQDVQALIYNETRQDAHSQQDSNTRCCNCNCQCCNCCNNSTQNGGFSWTRYHNLADIYKWLDFMENKHRGKVTVIYGGTSYERRQIKGALVSTGPRGARRPGVFVEAGIHAGEWIAPATATFLINELVNSQDPRVRSLASTYDWYIFPSVNPDGYEYSHRDPSNINNRLWRKSRSNCHSNTGNCRCGVDLNRNWNQRWGGENTQNPCHQHYAGPRPFSEPETATLSNYLRTISNGLTAYISLHGYSQYLMFPYGYSSQQAYNYRDLYSIGVEAVQALRRRYGTQYKLGSVSELCGTVTGNSLDYAKDVLRIPLVYAYDMRDNGKFGYLLPANQIIPNGQEIMESLKALFSEAQRYRYN